MVWVLPPPKAVWKLDDGLPPLPLRRRATWMRRRRIPSVMKVRWKKAAASWYSWVDRRSRTAEMSAANSDWEEGALEHVGMGDRNFAPGLQGGHCSLRLDGPGNASSRRPGDVEYQRVRVEYF